LIAWIKLSDGTIDLFKSFVPARRKDGTLYEESFLRFVCNIDGKNPPVDKTIERMISNAKKCRWGLKL
tara:strand:+ start:556 stop:759 length:204 start_codon:yes stop_codon:yes gene_type:complete